MIPDIADGDVGLLANLPGDRIFEALPWLHEAGDGRIPAFGPARLPTEQTAIPIMHQHDDRRIDAREDSETAFAIGADPGIAARFGAGWRAAASAIALHAVPDDQRPRVCDEVGFVDRQHAAEVTQIVELT